MIDLVNVTKRFDNKIVLLNLNASFKNGSINAIVGKNGIGKSTLLDCIVRPYYLDEGKILLDGVKIGSVEIRKNIFYLPTYQFMEENISAIDYLNFVSYIYNDRDFQVEKYREEIHKLGLATSMEDLIDTFSVGMKKKLYFIASLVSSADHLIYDELLNGIDAASAKFILKKLAYLKKHNKCIIMSTHNIELIKIVADKFFELKSKDALIEKDKVS